MNLASRPSKKKQGPTAGPAKKPVFRYSGMCRPSQKKKKKTGPAAGPAQQPVFRCAPKKTGIPEYHMYRRPQPKKKKKTGSNHQPAKKPVFQKNRYSGVPSPDNRYSRIHRQPKKNCVRQRQLAGWQTGGIPKTAPAKKKRVQSPAGPKRRYS